MTDQETMLRAAHEHDWERHIRGGYVMWIRCRICGKTPLETLDELPVNNDSRGHR